MSEIARTYRVILDAEMTARSRQAFNETIQNLDQIGVTVHKVKIRQRDLAAAGEADLEKMARSSLHVLRLCARSIDRDRYPSSEFSSFVDEPSCAGHF
jgi:putative heme degradation protein